MPFKQFSILKKQSLEVPVNPTLNSAPAIKVVENRIGAGQIQSLQQQQFTNKFNS